MVYNKETVVKLLKQLTLCQRLENAIAHEWEYGNPAYSDLYQEHLDRENENLYKLLVSLDLSIDDTLVSLPEIPMIEEEEDDEEGETLSMTRFERIALEDLMAVTERLTIY